MVGDPSSNQFASPRYAPGSPTLAHSLHPSLSPHRPGVNPIFCDRRCTSNALAYHTGWPHGWLAMGDERRNSYSWTHDKGNDVLDEYNRWCRRLPRSQRGECSSYFWE